MGDAKIISLGINISFAGEGLAITGNRDWLDDGGRGLRA